MANKAGEHNQEMKALTSVPPLLTYTVLSNLNPILTFFVFKIGGNGP